MNDPTLNDDTRQKIEEWKALGNSISSLFNYFNKKSKTHNEINTVAAQRLVDSLRQRLTDISSSDPNYDAAKKNYDEAVLNLEKAKNFEKAKSIVLDAEHAVSNLAKEKSSNDAKIKQAQDKLKRATDLQDFELKKKAQDDIDRLTQRNKEIAAEKSKKSSKVSGAAPTPYVSSAGFVDKSKVTQPAPTTGTKTGATGGAGGKKTKTPPAPAVVKTIDDIYKTAQLEFGIADTIFKDNDELKKLMTEAVHKQWDNQKFLNALTNTTWFQSNTKGIQQASFAKRQYDNLLKSGVDVSNTEFAQQTKKIKDNLSAQALALGAVFDDAQLQNLAEQLYLTNQTDNAAAVRNAIAGHIKYDPNLTKGAAAANLQELRQTARNNGLNFDKQFATQASSWLGKIAQGESIETFKNMIRNTAKVGLPENVAAILDSGVDLNTVIDPYKQVMARTLEVNPETIDLTDPSLAMALGGSSGKSLNLFDYQRALRKDNRYQYTSQARQEVSDIANKVLQDFGFIG